MTSTVGLTKDQLCDLRDLLIMASDDQLIWMRTLIEKEARKRSEVKMALLMNRPYGNEHLGYRLASGARVKELPQ